MDTQTSYAVCYAADIGGSIVGSIWYDTYIRVQFSKLTTLSAFGVTHTTSGQLAAVTTLDVVYAGTLGVNKWVSMVDQTLNNDKPCESGPAAAAPADSQHSGVVQAGENDKVLRFDTSSMSTSVMFAVCYTESYGN